MDCVLYIAKILGGSENYLQNIDEKTLKGILVFWNVTLRCCMNDS